MSTGSAELVRIASAELDSANLTDDGAGLSAVISSTLTRMLSNATLTADLMQHDVARRTVVPSARELATPLRDLAPHDSWRRLSVATLASHLNERGWAVLDDAVPSHTLRGAAAEAAQLLAAGALRREPRLGELRGDRSAMVLDGNHGTPHLAALRRRLLGAQRRLGEHAMRGARPGSLYADPDGAMVACYEHGERYARHTDRPTWAELSDPAMIPPPDAIRDRHLTMILYLGPGGQEWTPEEGGELRVWPAPVAASGGAGVGAGGSGPGLGGDLGGGAAAGGGGAAAALASPSASGVEIEPRAGRFALFDSGAVHEVQPVRGTRPRCALTLWVHSTLHRHRAGRREQRASVAWTGSTAAT